MLKTLINFCFIIPIFLIIPFSSNAQVKILAEGLTVKELLKDRLIKFEDIPDIVSTNNLELKSLKQLVQASSFDLLSKISKKYPKLDLNANGLPQYLYSESFNNYINNTKTSQYQINPSLNLRWDIIDPKRGFEISSFKDRYEVARNNYKIKKQDLIQEAKSRYHKYQKTIEDEKNAKIAVELSEISLKDANAKLEVGIGTKFEVLEANSQLERDKQLLKEKTIVKEINLIALKEILNIDIKEDVKIEEKQQINGFWFHPLEQILKSGLKNSLSLKNIDLQSLIKKNQAQNFNNANLPVVYISNSFSSSFSKGSALSTEIDPDRSSSTYSNKISLNLTWNFFDAGQNNNSAKAKRAEAEAEKFNYLNLQNVIKTNISEAYLNLLKNQDKLISTKQEILASKEALRLARLRYEVGISTLKDVLIRQKELTISKSRNIDAIYNYNINLDKLERLTFIPKNKNCDGYINTNENLNYSICNY
tara:strand:- start:81 stop:1514 length:1434 start_codon:yes stop_codon:yes gene_type:complete